MEPYLHAHVVLGSRSPQRHQLLKLILPEQRIVVAPPSNTDEQDFEGLGDIEAIRNRLRDIARTKNEDVFARRTDTFAAVLTADTTIVGFTEERYAHDRAQNHDEKDPASSACCTGERPVVLGQPPASNWQPLVREWFQRYYLGRTHTALTAICLTRCDGVQKEAIISTDVHMRTLQSDAEQQLLEWYLSTEEPPGKAGAYGIQGAASIFVDRIEGSVSNVIGLPLRETFLMFLELGILA